MHDTFFRRFGRAVGNLLLALINATLILVAVCLFLGLQLAGSVERVTTILGDRAGETLQEMAPYRDGLTRLGDEVAALRIDLASLRTSGSAGASEAAARVETRLAAFETRLDDVTADLGVALEGVRAQIEDPGAIVDRAVIAGIDRAGYWVASLRGCVLPEELSPAALPLPALAPPTSGG